MKKQSYISNSVIEQLSIGVLVFNNEDCLVYINNAAEELLDISERKAIGVSADKLIFTPSFDILNGFELCRTRGSKLTEHLVSFNNPIGMKRTISLSMTPVLADSEAENTVLVELVDFNHYSQVDHDREIQSQNELATDMLRGLAHEIKNPLGGIRGAAQLLSKELNGEYSDYIHVIIEEADRLRNLVDRMLGSSVLPNHQETNIHVILERVHQLVEAEVDDSIKIKVDYDPSIPEFMADRDQLIQAILNIVRNAAQALTEGGVITLRTRVHRNMTIAGETSKLAVKVDVIDDGPGIPEDMLTKVFYPLVTGKTDGTGLGLSIAQTNVHRHHGIIEVTSEPGETIFSTILPLERKHG